MTREEAIQILKNITNDVWSKLSSEQRLDYGKAILRLEQPPNIGELFGHNNADGMKLDPNNITFYEDLVIIGFLKEEPKYYAKIKGWELVTGGFRKFWHYDDNNKLCVSLMPSKNDKKATATKSEWNKLGINEKNADFEEVGE